MRKSKGTGGGVALMEVSHTQTSLGVRTRAKVALERLQKSASATAPPEAAAEGGGGRSYLQLRSRRLEKISPIGEGRRQRNIQKDSNSLASNRGHGQNGRGGNSRLKMKGAEVKKKEEEEEEEEKEKVSGDAEKLTEEVNLLGNEDEENKQGNQSSAAVADTDTGAEEACIGENVLEVEGRGRWLFLFPHFLFLHVSK